MIITLSDRFGLGSFHRLRLHKMMLEGLLGIQLCGIDSAHCVEWLFLEYRPIRIIMIMGFSVVNNHN